jgi:hypothetical protein
MVFVIAAEVISEPADAFRYESHLYFGGTGVTRLSLVLFYDPLFGRGV